MKQSELPRFDFAKRPIAPLWPLQGLAWVLSWLTVGPRQVKITKTNMDGIKPPYLLLCNHNAFNDFKIATMATYPHRANNVVAIDGFIGREWLLRGVGCLGKRKFTNDILLVRNLRRVLQEGRIAILYPEARYSLCGTTAVLPDSLGKMAKLFQVPVVMLLMHGDHINSPFWNLKDRGLKGMEGDMHLLLSQEQMQTLSAEEINATIREAFVYDEYAWQKEKAIEITFPQRAEGLHKVLYVCPHCGIEYQMTSQDDRLICLHCKKTWHYLTDGSLKADEGEDYFTHIPDWYEWERQLVRQEVEEGTYHFESTVRVDSLPNAKGFIDLGVGYLVHDANGFVLTGQYEGEEYRVEKPVPSMYSCHIEYNYLGKHGDCIDLNTADDTLYIYPEGKEFSVTKIALATEELHFHQLRSVKK